MAYGTLPNDGSNHLSQGLYVPGQGVAAVQGVLLGAAVDGAGNASAGVLVARPTTVLYGVASVAVAGAGSNTPNIIVSNYSEFALDIAFSGPTGGVSPNLTFFVDRLDANGNWVPKYTGTAQTIAGSISLDIGAGLSTAVSLGSTCRIRWVATGGATWTITSLSLIGK